MKKPTTYIEHDNPMGLHVEGVYSDRVEEAYNQMIDALIELRRVIDRNLYKTHRERDPSIELIDKALKKAGCK